MGQLPNRLLDIERTRERGHGESIEHAAYLAAGKTSLRHQILFGAGLSGALLRYHQFQYHRRAIANPRLAQDLLDIETDEPTGIQRLRAALA